MDNLIVDEGSALQDSTSTLPQVDSDVVETCTSQPPPPGTDGIEEFPFKLLHKQDAEENPQIDDCRSGTIKASESQNVNISMKCDYLNAADVLINLRASSTSGTSEQADKSQQAVEVSTINPVHSSQFDVPNSSKALEKISVTSGQNSEIAEPSSEKVEDVDLSKSNSSKALETIPKSLPLETCIETEKNSSSRKISKRRSQKERSISHSPRRKVSRSRSISYSCPRFSRSRSPVRFPVLSKSERRNYRRHSRCSSSSPSPRRYRSRSPSPRKCHSSSSYSSSYTSSPYRRRHSSSKSIKSRSAEKRYSRDSYEYRAAVKKVKYGSRSKVYRSRERSASTSPRNRRSSKRKSHSPSPKGRLRRLLAHETLSKNTGCVVRFDTSKSFSSREDGDNVEGGQHKIARVTSELRLEVKSTVNSEKLMENNKMNLFQQKVRVLKKRLRHERREFKKRPESYPTFAEEWRMFWCNRFKQIEADGKEDPHNYDYRPDWTRYWLIRVKQIYKEKYKKLKSELREDLEASCENKSKNVVNSEVVVISDGHESASPLEEETPDRSAETKDCQKNNDKDVESNETQQKLNEENSAVNSISSVTMQQLNLLTQTLSACMSSACLPNSAPSIESASNFKDSQPAVLGLEKSEDSVDIDLKDDISVISVLRQLSVLETQLGSSATPVTNLLANGLAREKKQAGSSVRLLTRENRLFLDVIKEKLKGQLILEVVPDAMIKATMRCIRSIDELMRVIPEPKLPDPRLNRIPPEKSNSSDSPASLASTTRNNFSNSTYSMPSAFPTAAVNSVPVFNSSVPVHSISQPTAPVQVVSSQPQNTVRYDPYFAPASHGTSLRTEYPVHSIHATNQGCSIGGSAAPRQSISNKMVGTFKTDARSDQMTSVSRVVQSALTGMPSSTTYSFENKSEMPRRPSIYDKIPWSEQSAGTSIPAARLPSQSSTSGLNFRPSTRSISDPRLMATTSSIRPQIPHISSSIPSQISTSIPLASHSRTIPTGSNTHNFQTVLTPSSNGARVTSVNVPSNDSRFHSMVSTFDSVDTPSMTSVSCSSVMSTAHSISSNVTTPTPATPAGSQILTASSSTTVVNASSETSPAVGSVIDLTDDSPEYDENTEPINRLSEARIIQLLKNFRQIPRARQQQLVDFLRELEKTNLATVENFKKYVQLPFNK